jgi:hypothetical protein
MHFYKVANFSLDNRIQMGIDFVLDTRHFPRPALIGVCQQGLSAIGSVDKHGSLQNAPAIYTVNGIQVRGAPQPR